MAIRLGDMATRCPICGAENPEGKKFCGDCGSKLPEPYSSSVPLTGQSEIKRDWKGLKAFVSSRRGRAILIAVVVTIVVCIVLVATLGYYYEPVRGTLSPSSTTIVKGGSVQFDFNPSQGIAPFKFAWNFGDGTGSSEKAPIHTYVVTGSYVVTVTVTDGAGVKGSWTTAINVRLPLVFIDSVQVTFTAVLGTSNTTLTSAYDYNMWVDGTIEVSHGAHPNSYIVGLLSGTTHTFQVQILQSWGTKSDDKGSMTMPTTSSDLHCILWYSTWTHSFMTDGIMAAFALLPA